jgi:hypothetical protein
MKKIDQMTNELSHVSNRHNTFRNIFKTFQKNIDHLQSDTFPVKGIKLENVSDKKTFITFIERTYELNFTSCMVNGAIKGKISVSRIFGEKSANEFASITYNGQSIADVTPPQGEDPISLAEDSCCLNLVLNWLSNEINP